jgi:hypothetical protein
MGRSREQTMYGSDMRTLGGLSMLLMVAAIMALAWGNDSVSLHGYVVDQHCAKGMAEKTNTMGKAASHSKVCLLMESCSRSGYGIFSNGKYYPFDGEGSVTAKSLIARSKRADRMYFEAKGKLDNGTLTHVSLEEATPEQKSETSGTKSHGKPRG